MSGYDLSLANVFTVSVSTPQTGVGEFNTSNLAIFTRESYQTSFGSLGYKIYLEPTEVGEDFGTSSNTYAMANAVFSQKPNILAGGGYLVVIPMLGTAQTAVQTITFSSVPTAGNFLLNYNGDVTTAIAYNASQSAIQVLVRTLTGLEAATVVGTCATSIVITCTGISGAVALMTISSNTLTDAELDTVTPTVTTTTIGFATETIDKAITRTVGLVQYFGVMQTEIPIQTQMLAGAAVIQALNKIAFWLSVTAADVNPGGYIDLLRSGTLTQNRGLFYGVSLATGLVYMASYAGRGMSTNFNGSKTTQTMHLKTLAAVQPDSTMSQSLLTLCIAAGADTYVSLQGVSKVFCSGENDYYDNQYNLQWFVGALLVAEFNSLAQVDTKLPQTENGMDVMKNGATQVCEQGVTNGFIAPGTWTSPTTFGNQEDLYLNVSQKGYYIYSAPISQQLPAVRAARTAPLIQVAIKYAGAIHSGSAVINVNP